MISDVVNLFPSLEVEDVVVKMREAVLKSNIEWEEIDYREGVRYLALNWDKQTCMRSSLRRVLPVRRGKRGWTTWQVEGGPRTMDLYGCNSRRVGKKRNCS